jgi:hypothetical protein
MDYRHGRHLPSRRDRRWTGAIALGAIVTCLGAPAVAAAGPPLPPTGTSRYHWLRAECVETDQGYRSIARVRTHVLSIVDDGDAQARYYQEVKIQIDRSVDSTDTTWRKVAARSYDWSRFTSSQTPTYSTSAMRTGLQPDAGTLSAKVTVWLKRTRPGPDKTVWRYRARSATFSCLPGGMLLPAAPALPSPGGS